MVPEIMEVLASAAGRTRRGLHSWLRRSCGRTPRSASAGRPAYWSRRRSHRTAENRSASSCSRIWSGHLHGPSHKLCRACEDSFRTGRHYFCGSWTIVHADGQSCTRIHVQGRRPPRPANEPSTRPARQRPTRVLRRTRACGLTRRECRRTPRRPSCASDSPGIGVDNDPTCRRHSTRSGGDEDSVRRVFQALRIAVNDEFGALEALLRNLPFCLKAGGRVAILTFHSGEDRRVKKSFQAGERGGTYDQISHGVVRATSEELRANPRSSSAKLRWARRSAIP